jgi:squalene-hopene/tetraprenyl-beta-curcumene cyclase
VTALAVKAFAQAGHVAADDRTAARAMAFLRAHTGVGGAFEPDPSSGLGTYVASTLLMALAAQQDDALSEQVAQVRGWLREVQWDQAEGHAPDSDWFGGYGYGNRGRPDLSNTQLVLDALHDAGVSTDDPAVQRALAFVARTQNVATNAEAWAQKGSKDGGFVYTPAGGGESFASEAAGEGRKGENLPEGTRSLRSYGSMTYAGLKSMLYAGLTPSDPRVRAAFEWIRMHYGFAENPGLGAQGHYYYLHTAARTLLATNEVTVTQAAGESPAARNWRDDLVDAVCGMQQPDGSWKNPVERWMEGQPELATVYAVLALEEAIKPVTRSR